MVKGKISVVLPVHYVNRGWLDRSIKSVLSQDYRDFELIVVNDMATENIDDMIKEYGIKKYLKNGRRMRLSFSFNRGFEAAEGEYFSWVAADDFMLPGMLTKLAVELVKRPEVAIISGRTKVIDSDGNVVEQKLKKISVAEQYGYKFENDVLDKRYVIFSTISSCWLLRRQVWEQTGGFDENLYGEEDYDFWIRAARDFKIYRLTYQVDPLYVYRVHAKSISRTVPYCYSKARINILKREQRLFPGEEPIRKAIAHFKKKQLLEWKKREIYPRISSLKRKLTRILEAVHE
ncbi:MAG: glycosyltransferase [Candidatus Omnitrophica bacterium]|nr:glycosyltransferase [Candidatus Omnitrophota bacterium]MDD5553452.1 glycosyltransferase [Candidatus Omnitrophota bacterium]